VDANWNGAAVRKVSTKSVRITGRFYYARLMGFVGCAPVSTGLSTCVLDSECCRLTGLRRALVLEAQMIHAHFHHT
jgi:hypothetical protein